MLLLTSERPGEEKFIPPDLEDASMIACGVGGLKVLGEDTPYTAKTFVQVEYAHGRSKPYIVTISIRGNAESSGEDCVKWWHDIKPALEAAQARREASKRP